LYTDRVGPAMVPLVIHCRSIAVVMRHLKAYFCFYQKYATRMSVCVNAVSKSQEFLLKVPQLFIFLSTTSQTLPC